ncbi:MAG TPA: hypothetical protein VF615_16135 [Longimicrobiaceae bacterium]|jgi:hypothetical protein
MGTFRVLAAAALVLPLAACGSPLDDTCVDRSVVVEMPATVSVGAGQFTQPLALAGTLGEDNVDPAVFTRIRRIAADAEEGSGAFVFTLEPRGGSTGTGAEFLSLALRLPLRDGDVVDVSTAFQGGGWGLVTLAAGEDAAASLRVAGAYARSFAGTVTVLEASPLRLRVDLRAVAAGGETLRVRGDAAFALAEDRAPCS